MRVPIWLLGGAVAAAISSGCGGAASPRPTPSAVAFHQLTDEVLKDYFHRNPTAATSLGIHTYDDRIEDFSAPAIADALAATRAFRRRLQAIDPAGLSRDDRVDREWLLHVFDAAELQLDVIRPWAKDPDTYSSGLTSAAYVLIKRSFAPPEVRMARLTKRMEAMPAALETARRNLEHPPRVYTDIAIQQIDGNRDFFQTAVVDAFASVTDPQLVRPFNEARVRVVQAMADYKDWLQSDLLPRSTGDFAYGADTYRRRLEAEEMIDTPLDRLLIEAETDLRRNQAAFADVAHQIAPGQTPASVLASVQQQHPDRGSLLGATQSELDALAGFIRAHHIVTVPEAPPVQVIETPPFLRATTSASMDIPGPFEARAAEAYYNMTLPDPAWPQADRDAYMRQWYYPAITNVSVHEVWPGHYLQFLYAKRLTSDVRKVFGAASNSEGWAHYVEQMMADEGFHADDPRYRLAQLQDALLRDARFIVGIRLHTAGMTLTDAEAFFEREAYQPPPVAKAETRRGTSDATYGYYTMGKLAILALRDEYRAKEGADFTLQRFHDAFIQCGPIPVPLVREILLQ
jgi:uncharacterized protein (DUF885 family)